MIHNNICEFCSHGTVCKVADKLAPFDESAKRDLGVEIEIKDCANFKDINAIEE